MKKAFRLLLALTLACALSMPLTAHAQGAYVPYATRITQRLDRAAGLKRGATPVPVSITYPDYPLELSRAGVSGKVAAEFTVVADGQVQDIKIVKADQPEFSAAVLAAMKSWRFVPLNKMGPGYPTSIRIVATFDFEMPDL